MAVSFDRSSATLVVNTPPGVFDPVVGIEPLHPIGSLSDFADDLRIAIDAISGNKVFFACSTISATGIVNLTGAAGDNASGWELGFLQAQWIETNWGHYKADWTNGAAMKGGSLLLQRGKPPARPKQSCRDIGDGAPAANIWYARTLNQTGRAGAFPQTLTAVFRDTPGELYPALVWNSITKQDNFVRDVQLEFLFCTALALREPGGRFHILKHFFWNVLWQATFQPVDFTNARYGPWRTPIVLNSATQANRSKVFDGGPDKEPWRGILTSTTETETCNDVFRKARDQVLTPPFVGRREHVDRDHPYDVRV